MVTFNLVLDVGLLLANALQGAVTGGCTAIVVLVVTRRMERYLARGVGKKGEDGAREK